MKKEESPPWVAVSDVCHMYGVSYLTAKNRISQETFPVKTYKVGKILVIDRIVHETYFGAMREEGLAHLRGKTAAKDSTKGGQKNKRSGRVARA